MLISVESWILFSIFFFIYIWVKRSTRTAMLLYVTAFSLFYYFRFNGVLGLVLLPATALVNYLLVERMRRGDRKKLFLSLTILADLGVLAYFKYAGFFVEGILNPLLGSNFDIGRIAVPVGISFYTFQAISYAVDVYRGRFTLRPDFLEYLFYLSFFPLLLAGPITRAETLFPQMRENRPADRRDVWGGFYLIISGLLKKGVIADYIAQYNNFVFGSPGTFSALECFLAIVGFTIQIYYDFSGYSDISIGIASMMGFRLKDNFRMPYRSLNLTDFWRRWHISLSSWFRDYLYIPLGGNRKGTFRTMLNNFLTMLVAGIWHGASWMFIIWGGLHGLGLVVHKSCRKFLSRIPDNVFTKDNAFLTKLIGENYVTKFNLTCMCIGLIAAIVFIVFRIHKMATQKKLNISQSIPAQTVSMILISALILWVSFKLSCYRGFPMVLIWIILVLGIYAYITTKTAIGRHLYAVGGNEKATALSGVKTRNVYWFAYANIGLLAGLAGILTAGRAKGIDPVYGEGYEMDAIASCFIGGASAYGGSGTVSGMIVGAILMGVINKGMIIVGVDANYQKVVKGIVLLVAVMFDVLSKRQKR